MSDMKEIQSVLFGSYGRFESAGFDCAQPAKKLWWLSEVETTTISKTIATNKPNKHKH